MFCKKYSTALLAACTACILLLSGCNFASQGRSNEEIRLADPEATEQDTTAETSANVNEVDPEYYLGLLSGCNFASQGRSNEEIRLADPEATEQDTTAETSANVNEVDPEYYLGETTFIGDSRTNGLLTYQLLPPEQVFAIDGSTQKTIRVNEVDPEYYLGETTFIGDSRTNGLLTYQLLPPEQVFAIDGSTQKTIRNDPFIQLGPDSDQLTVEQAVEQRQPHRLVIAFGVNAIPLMTEEEFMQEYDLLIDQLTDVSPNSRIVIQAILPVSGWKYQEMSYLTNENIDHYNRLLKEYSEENGYIFFDISSEFKDEEGNLAREFDAGDGLHFNQNFYQHYIQLLIQYQP